MSWLRSKKLIYFVFCCTNILINIDQGVLPAATNEMMIDLDLTEVEFGCLGSLMYIGLIAGSTIAGYIYQRFSCKRIVIFNLCCTGICLSFFTYTGNIYFLGFSRISTGFFQVFLVIFFPVWVDIFGGKSKTLWLTILQIGVPMGTFFGYILTVMSLALLNWKWGFWLQILLMVPSLVLFILFHEDDLNTQRRENRIMSDDLEEKLRPKSDDEKNNEIEIVEMSQTAKINRKSSESPELANAVTPNYWESLKIVMTSKVYICSMLSISSLYFIVTGMQFWGTDYFRNVMHQEKDIVFLTYSSVSISAPTLGVLFGGYYVHRQGGYTSEHALKICLILSWCAAIFACPFPFVKIYPVSVGMMWCLLFFGGSLMPTLTGVMISSVPREYRAFGNSAAQFFLNLFGFLPAPFVYGFVCNLTGGRSSLWGMASLMAWSLFGLINIFLAFHLDKRKRKEVQNEENIDTATDKEKEKLSSISESSDSKKEIKMTGMEENAKSEKKLEGENSKEEKPPVLKKKSSMLQFNLMKSIVPFSEIPKVKFPRSRKGKLMNCSYEQKRDVGENDARLAASQTYVGGGTGKHESRLRYKSTSINYEQELNDSHNSHSEKK